MRAGSSNTRVVEALPLLAPPDVTVEIYRGIGGLPFFNLDLETDAPPPAVAQLRDRVGACDGLVICSPEYAHGVAGVMKNVAHRVRGRRRDRAESTARSDGSRSRRLT